MNKWFVVRRYGHAVDGGLEEGFFVGGGGLGWGRFEVLVDVGGGVCGGVIVYVGLMGEEWEGNVI